MTEWEIQGRELINCNCAYGCPCQFNSRPTNGHCHAIGAVTIDRGHHGKVKLDGLTGVMVLKWPGAIHEGRGQCQLFIDSRANDEQRAALLRIMSGADTEPFATFFAVFATTYEKVFDPVFAPVEVQIDVDARRGHVRVGEAVEIKGEPIHNPVTGQEHRARIDLPHGFEYEVAEIASGSGRARGDLQVELSNSHAQFAHLHMNNQGLIRHRASA